MAFDNTEANKAPPSPSTRTQGLLWTLDSWIWPNITQDSIVRWCMGPLLFVIRVFAEGEAQILSQLVSSFSAFQQAIKE